MTEPAEVPLHPTAVEILERVVPAEDGAASVIPVPRFAALQQRLQGRREETELFVHLCVLCARLRDRGLGAAAEQLLALARIGLAKSEVEQTLDEIDRARRSARSLAGTQATGPGAALKAGVQLGVGLHTGGARRSQSPSPSRPRPRAHKPDPEQSS